MVTQEQTKAWTNPLNAQLAKRNQKKRRAGRWHCSLGEMIIGDYLIMPLTSTKMLKSESYWMQNCCRDYAEMCLTTDYALFSIRSRSGERLATLGLKKDQGYYHFDQCFGPANSDVLEETFAYLDDNDSLQTEFYPTEIYYIAHEIVRLMNGGASSH